METLTKAKASVSDAIATIVSDYFAQVGAKNELFSTSDGNVFENQGFARNHAATLEDKNVTPHTNVNNLDVVDSEDLGLEEEEDTPPPSGSAATQDNK